MTTEPGNILDQADAMRRRDPGGMLGRIGELGAQLRSGWDLSRGLALGDLHRSARTVAVLGMGGSAVCADIARATFVDRLTVPIVSVRDYDLPAWVSKDTLVVAISHSGATEETISALTTALEKRVPVAVITTGGPIGEVAKKVGLPRLIYDAANVPPRASLGYTLSLLSGLLERAGMLDLSEAEVESAISAVTAVAKACGPEVLTEENMAKQLAWSLLDRLPVIEGSGAMAAVARRWKTQINENSHSIAVAEELPEAMHNAVVGYDQPDALRDHQYFVFLRSASDSPRNAFRAELSRELLNSVGIAHQEVTIEGEGRFAQACAAISLGDYVSAYMALLYGVDPSSTPVLTHVKERMAQFGTDDDGADDDADDRDADGDLLN